LRFLPFYDKVILKWFSIALKFLMKRRSAMVYDPELHAMGLVFGALKNLDNDQQRRVLRWVKDRLESPEPTGIVSTDADTPDDMPIHMIANSQDSEPKIPEQKDIRHYDTVMDLFSDATAKKSTSKVLLMASYLQERHSFKEITSYEINFRLKRIGHKVTNISSLINSLLNRRPHLLIQVGADTHKKQARRKFRVTEDGLKEARSFLNK
jgi:hypothetical protein